MCLQLRTEALLSFDRTYDEYKSGFGDLVNLASDYWLGLERLHLITNNEARAYTLDVTMEYQTPPTANTYYQSYYSGFLVDNATDGYRVHIHEYSTAEGKTLRCMHTCIHTYMHTYVHVRTRAHIY